MDKQQFLAQLKNLIADADVDKALELLDTYLEQDPKFKRLHNEVVQISSIFNKAKRDEARGLVSFENAKLSYNQVNNQLLNLLEHIETDNLNPEGLTPAATVGGSKHAFKWWLIGGIPVLALAVFLVVKLTSNSSSSTGDEDTSLDSTAVCPVFKPTSKLNVMVLPYVNVSGSNDQPEQVIAEKLNDLIDQNPQIQAVVRVASKQQQEQVLSYSEADSVAKYCQAHLIVWGRFERSNEGNIISTRFRFRGEKGALEFKKIRWQGERQVDSLRTLSSIISEGTLTADIEEVIAFFFGVTLSQTAPAEEAIASLEKLQPQDSITHLLRNMILADKYLETEQKGKALATLDSLLKLHPNYWLARNNRGMLLLEQGDYMGAIEDFNNAIQNNKKEDADLHVAKARALQKSEQLVEAKKEYEKAIEIDTTKRKDVERPLQQTKKAIELNQTKLRQAPKETKAAPAKQELIEKIDANVKLGTVENKKEARRLVAKGIEQYPTEASFYVADILVLWQQNKKKEAWAKYNEALKKGVNREELNALLKAKNVKMERLKQVEK